MDGNLEKRLNSMVRDLLNRHVVPDKRFRVTTAADADFIVRVFGHTLTPGQVQKLKQHDGVVALFVRDSDGEAKVGKTVRDDRANYKNEAARVVSALEPYLGKPVVEVWQGIDPKKNLFGAQSFFVCCFFALDGKNFSDVAV